MTDKKYKKRVSLRRKQRVERERERAVDSEREREGERGLKQQHIYLVVSLLSAVTWQKELQAKVTVSSSA